MGSNSFTLFVGPHLWGGGRVPSQVQPAAGGGGTQPGPASWGGTPNWGLPHLEYHPVGPGRGAGVTPPRITDGVLDTPRSGMLLAFTEEDFLVQNIFSPRQTAIVNSNQNFLMPSFLSDSFDVSVRCTVKNQ